MLVSVVIYPYLSREGPPYAVTDNQIRRTYKLALKGEMNASVEEEFSRSAKAAAGSNEEAQQKWSQAEAEEVKSTNEGVVDEGGVYIEFLSQIDTPRFRERLYAIQRK